jgi:arylformamidase
VSGAVSISGLYDLTEIAKVPSINGDVRLTEKTAIRVSPAFMPPATDAPLVTAVGADENQGFHIQNRIIGEKWAAVHRADITCAGKNHFTVLDVLGDPGSRLFKSVLGLTEL